MQRDRFKQLKRLDERLKKGAYNAESGRYSAHRHDDLSQRQSPRLHVAGLPRVEQLKQPKQLDRSPTRASTRQQTGQHKVTSKVTSSARRRHVSLAAEETIRNGQTSYKSLPRLRDSSKASNAHIPVPEKPDRLL